VVALADESRDYERNQIEKIMKRYNDGNKYIIKG
jgi:hypothetical protein